MKTINYFSLLTDDRGEETTNSLIDGIGFSMTTNGADYGRLLATDLALDAIDGHIYWKWIGPNHRDIQAVAALLPDLIFVFEVSEKGDFDFTDDVITSTCLNIDYKLKRLAFLPSLRVFLYRPSAGMMGVLLEVDFAKLIRRIGVADTNTVTVNDIQLHELLHSACQILYALPIVTYEDEPMSRSTIAS